MPIKCPKCNRLISTRFPVHNCVDNMIKVIDGDNQIIKYEIRKTDANKEMQKLRESGYEDVTQDHDGDIVFFKEL